MADDVNPDELKKRVLDSIDRDEVTRIACDLIDIPSPTGYEKQCAEYILERYRAAGLKVLPQDFDEERANAIGVLKGNGTGPCLMLNGHMDTSYVGDEQYLPDKPGYRNQHLLDGEWLYGLGVYNMKGSLAAFIHAVEAVSRAGVELNGDVMIACVAGEIEKSQVDRYQGQLYRGGACGTWYAITHGAVPDFAVVGEPSGLTLMRAHGGYVWTRITLMRAHGGYVWTRITLIGDPKHTIFGRVEDNTINNMLKIAHRVQAWGDDYEKRAGYLGMGAKVTLSAIEGGWPYRCSRVPVACTLYVDTRLMPGQSPLQVQREMEELIAGIRREDPDLGKLHLDMNIFMNQWGSECDPGEYVFKETERAHREVFGTDPHVTAVPFASDACEIVAHGIPALNYGVTGRTREQATGTHYNDGESDWNPEQGEHCSIEDLYQGTRVYASLMLNVCSRTREELGIKP